MTLYNTSNEQEPAYWTCTMIVMKLKSLIRTTMSEADIGGVAVEVEPSYQ